MSTLIKVFDVWNGEAAGKTTVTEPQDPIHRIIYPRSSFSHLNPTVIQVVDNFITAMESYLKVERHVVDLEDQWAQDNPSGTGQPLAEYLQKLGSTAQDKTEMLVRKKQFAQWLEAKILKGGGHTLIGNMMIWPFSPQEPQYRDEYPPITPHVNWRWDIDYSAPLAGLPQLTVPRSDKALINILQGFLTSFELPNTVKTGSLAFFQIGFSQRR